MSRRLIVNADDFGASEGVNRGIVECHRAGIVTSASLMVTRAGAQEAAALSGATPELAVGLHWDAIGERQRACDLRDEQHVRRELAAQLDRFHELMGHAPTHVDSHHHAHLRHEVRALFEELVAPLGVPLRGHGEVRFIGDFHAQRERGVSELQRVSVAALQRILRNEVGEGWTELCCHPGYITPGYRTTYRHEREAEIRTLTDPRIRATIEQLGLALESHASYREPVPGP
jgi:chitin disaccharide deacetylase